MVRKTHHGTPKWQPGQTPETLVIQSR